MIITVIGCENSGKSSLISKWCGQYNETGNFAGLTVDCKVFQDRDLTFIDTPGLMRQSDAETAILALNALTKASTVLLLARATNLLEDLSTLLPLANGKSGTLLITFADRLDARANLSELIAALGAELNLETLAIDTRKITSAQKEILERALREGRPIPPIDAVGPRCRRLSQQLLPDNASLLLSKSVVGPILALFMLVAPAYAAVWCANNLADYAMPWVESSLAWPLSKIDEHLGAAAGLFGGKYGLVGMLPFLFLYALPTSLAFAFLLSIYKASGLLDRIGLTLHPWLIRAGLTGRDIARVVMGFGCNVPAVLSSRSCSSCQRGNCIAAISFSSACSYQLPATLAVFAVSDHIWLAPAYLIALIVGGIVFVRAFSNPQALSLNNRLLVSTAQPIQLPDTGFILRETYLSLREFAVKAFPIFILICILAGLAEVLGILPALSMLFTPLMALLGLPAETAATVVFASIRKDGILLLTEGTLLSGMSPVQILAATFLAGTILPCLVTVLTIRSEMGNAFALRMLARQALVSIVITALISIFGNLIDR